MSDLNNNICFIHVATIGEYQNIFDEILSYINFNYFSEVIVNIAGTGFLNVNHNIKVIERRSNLEDYEFSTLDIIKNYCLQNKSNICYIHTKGASTQKNICIDEWRQYMLYFNLGNIPLIENILKTNDACGVDLVDTPTEHFSGNFWWSTSDHINSLNNPREIPLILSERHKCEFWICSNNKGKYFSLHNSNINVYERHLTRYPKKLYENYIN